MEVTDSGYIALLTNSLYKSPQTSIKSESMPGCGHPFPSWAVQLAQHGYILSILYKLAKWNLLLDIYILLICRPLSPCIQRWDFTLSRGTYNVPPWATSVSIQCVNIHVLVWWPGQIPEDFALHLLSLLQHEHLDSVPKSSLLPFSSESIKP